MGLNSHHFEMLKYYSTLMEAIHLCLLLEHIYLGLVMFGDIDEMHQALNEMNNHVLLSKADHPSGALLSVVQHVLQLQQYQVC